MREDRASTELTAARRSRDAAQVERDRKQQDLDAFNSTKEERRDRIYDAVIGHVVSQDTLDMARDAVTEIDEEGLMLSEARQKAQHVLEQKCNEAETARIKYVDASRNKSKIEMHKTAWEEEDQKEQERREDSEMEEFTGRKMVN